MSKLFYQESGRGCFIASTPATSTSFAASQRGCCTITPLRNKYCVIKAVSFLYYNKDNKIIKGIITKKVTETDNNM